MRSSLLAALAAALSPNIVDEAAVADVVDVAQVEEAPMLDESIEVPAPAVEGPMTPPPPETAEDWILEIEVGAEDFWFEAP